MRKWHVWCHSNKPVIYICLLQSHAGYRWYWMPPLVWSLVLANTSTLHRCFVTLFTGCQSLRGYSSRLLLWPSTVSEVLVLSTSSKSSAQSRICHVSHSVRLTAVTCSFRGQTRPSASEVSPSRLLSSGTHFHLTSAHCSTVANSSDQSWKPISSDQSTTLHDSSENNSLKSVTVTVTIHVKPNVHFTYNANRIVWHM